MVVNAHIFKLDLGHIGTSRSKHMATNCYLWSVVEYSNEKLNEPSIVGNIVEQVSMYWAWMC